MTRRRACDEPRIDATQREGVTWTSFGSLPRSNMRPCAARHRAHHLTDGWPATQNGDRGSGMKGIIRMRIAPSLSWSNGKHPHWIVHKRITRTT